MHEGYVFRQFCRQTYKTHRLSKAQQRRAVKSHSSFNDYSPVISWEGRMHNDALNVGLPERRANRRTDGRTEGGRLLERSTVARLINLTSRRWMQSMMMMMMLWCCQAYTRPHLRDMLLLYGSIMLPLSHCGSAAAAPALCDATSMPRHDAPHTHCHTQASLSHTHTHRLPYGIYRDSVHRYKHCVSLSSCAKRMS